MKLSVNVRSETELLLRVNEKVVHCWRDGEYIFDDLDGCVEVQVLQAESPCRWYMFPVYMVGGLMRAVFDCGTEFRADNHLQPYLHQCRFKLMLHDDTHISVSSVASKVQAGKCVAGHIKVEDRDVTDLEYQREINQVGFRSALMKGAYPLGGVWCILLVLLVYMCIAASSKAGAIVCAVVLLLLAVLMWFKLREEKQRLKILKEHVLESSDPSFIEV